MKIMEMIQAKAVVLFALVLMLLISSASCGGGEPALGAQPPTSDPAPSATSSGSTSGSSSGTACTSPCSSSTLYSPDVTTVFDPQQIGAVRDADQFPGGDFAAKINAAIANLPADGGTVDARNFLGPQTASSSIVLNKDVRLLLPPVRVSIAGAPLVIFAADGSQVIGAGNERTELIRTDAGDTIEVDSSALRSNLEVRNLTVGALQQSSTKSAAINIENANHVSIRNVVVHGGYYGIRFSGTLDVSLRDFYIDTSAESGLFFEERQSAAFPCTTGGYIANGQIERTLGDGIDFEGFVDRVAILQVDCNSNGGTGFLINTAGRGIDSSKWGFERFISCYASSNTGSGFDIKSNNNKFFDIYAETGSGSGILVSGANNDFFYAQAVGFGAEGFEVSGADNRFHSIFANLNSNGVDFLPGSDGSEIFGGSINSNKNIGIDVQAKDIALYGVNQSLNANGNLSLSGTLKSSVGNDDVPDVLGRDVSLGQNGPQVLQAASQAPPPGPCTPGSLFLVTIPSTVNMYVCEGSPTPGWVAR